MAASGDIGANAIQLPGLNSPSLIPILAKVEFDIDRRRAGWYDAWVRSRKVQHAKRAESRLGGRSRMGSEAGDGADDESQSGSRKAPIGLELLGRINADGSPVPSFLLTRDKSSAGDTSAEDDEDVKEEAGYAQLAESPVRADVEEEQELVEEDEEDEEEEEEEEEEEVPEEVPSGNGDPLVDVFGTDAETWAEVHEDTQANRTSVRDSNPNVVPLALDAAALSSLPDDLEENDEEEESDAEGEVTQLLNAMNRPSLSLEIPSSPPPPGEAATATAGTIKKHVPPPLDLTAAEGLHPPDASPNPTDGGQSAHLPYLGLATPSEAGDVMSREPPIEIDVDVDDLFKTSKSPQDEKREGAIFDDLNLGLDPGLDDVGGLVYMECCTSLTLPVV